MSNDYYQIKDFAKVKGGKRLPKGQFVQDSKTNHPYIRVTDMTANGLDASGIKYVPESIFEKISRYTISSNDVYISNAGTVGLVGKVPINLSGASLTENSAKITDINNNIVNQDYLRSHDGQYQIKSRVGGSSQPKLALDRIETISVPKLPIGQQTKITAVISNYEDLIENNEKRIKILEEKAKRLYSEWFVKFRFPGNEKIKRVDLPLGKIPEGWEVKTVGDVLELAYGKALIGSAREGGIFPVYGSSGKVGSHTEKLVSGPGIVVGRKGNVGSIFWVDDDFYPIDTTFYVKSSLDLEFVYYLLKEQTFKGGDSAVPGLNRGYAYSKQVVIPSQDLISIFSNQISKYFKLTKNIRDQNINLTKARDLLIPQLVTGRRELKN